MKKRKLIVGSLALFVAIGSAFAFKANTTDGNLWYWYEIGDCRKAPCATYDEIGEPCRYIILFTDEQCNNFYTQQAYATDGGK